MDERGLTLELLQAAQAAMDPAGAAAKKEEERLARALKKPAALASPLKSPVAAPATATVTAAAAAPRGVAGVALPPKPAATPAKSAAALPPLATGTATAAPPVVAPPVSPSTAARALPPPATVPASPGVRVLLPSPFLGSSHCSVLPGRASSAAQGHRRSGVRCCSRHCSEGRRCEAASSEFSCGTSSIVVPISDAVWCSRRRLWQEQRWRTRRCQEWWHAHNPRRLSPR